MTGSSLSYCIDREDDGVDDSMGKIRGSGGIDFFFFERYGIAWLKRAFIDTFIAKVKKRVEHLQQRISEKLSSAGRKLSQNMRSKV